MSKRTGDRRRKLELRRERLRVLSAPDVAAVVGGQYWEMPTDPQRDSAGRAYSKTCRE